MNRSLLNAGRTEEAGAKVSPPPSRAANPFATCWTRPGALPWCGDTSVVVDRLRRARWRGQVVGPHGSGKSTLMHALIEPLRSAGWRPVLVDSQAVDRGDGDLLLVEAFERLPRREQRRRIAAWSRAGTGFVVTTHQTLWGHPTLRGWVHPPRVVATTAPDHALVVELFARLTKRVPTSVTVRDAIASFASRDGDLREVWFDLYLLHEDRTRPARTPRVEPA
jgi:hypothetical protein